MNPYQTFLRKALALVLAVSVNAMTIGCKAAPPAEQSAQANAASPESVPSSPGYYDDLLKPIALYPDVLIAQILTAAVNPQEVLDAGNWLLQNTNLQESQRQDAAKKVGFGPSIQALVLFPEVVDMMCQNMDWTKQLGEAFKADQKGVLAAAQRLRQEAVNSGALKTTPQQTVTTKSENGQTVIVIQPTNPQVIYVPQYNPQVVYTAPPPTQPATTTTTTTTTQQKDDTGEKVAIGLLSFGVGMALGAAISNNNNYYGYPNWGYGGVYYGPRVYAPTYVYRPVYPGYHPATGYPRPVQYPYGGRYGNNTNVNVNVNNNYFNQFNKNANISKYPATTNRQPRPSTQPAAAGQGNQNWRGQSTYAGANRAGTSPATQDLARNRTGTANTGGAANRAGTQPMTQNRGAATTGTYAGANRGTQMQAKANTPPATRGSSSTTAYSGANRSADRGYGASQTRSSADSGRSNAFSGSGSARSERAASQRGRASAGASRGGGGRRR